VKAAVEGVIHEGAIAAALTSLMILLFLGSWRSTVIIALSIPLAILAAIAALVDDLVIRPGGILRHREWGLYEVGINGPDGLLVRIGWPSELIEGA